MGGTTVIAETGVAPPADMAHEAHAGCLSFELSSGRQRFIVNCGVDEFGAEDFRPLARATAAHSTATINDTSSARFAITPQLAELIGTPLMGGPRKVEVARNDSLGVQGFAASHDGYVPRFGIHHERELALSAEGDILEGSDRFFRTGGARPPDDGRDLIALRFHVHPAIGLFRDRDDRMVLKGPGSELWIFTCREVEAVVEDSIFFAGLAGPQRSRQIVLSFKASEVPEVNWRFRRMVREA